VAPAGVGPCRATRSPVFADATFHFLRPDIPVSGQPSFLVAVLRAFRERLVRAVYGTVERPISLLDNRCLRRGACRRENLPASRRRYIRTLVRAFRWHPESVVLVFRRRSSLWISAQTPILGSLANFASAEITIGNISAPVNNQFNGFGSFTPTPGGFSSEVGSKGTGLAGGFAFLDFSATFTQNGVVADASLRAVDLGPFGRTLDFKVSSESLAVSPVPLSPALPLFAAALLALGIVGYVRRAKDATPAHGQAY
jgi:hypothetical protein